MNDQQDFRWNRLKFYHLLSSSNPSIVENRLPFGMERKLKPLIRLKTEYIGHIGKESILKRQQFRLAPTATDKIRTEKKVVSEKDKAVGSVIKPVKFIPHKVNEVKLLRSKLSDESVSIYPPYHGTNSLFLPILYFDPSALMFFKEKDDGKVGPSELLQMNMTSNGKGTVSADKTHLGAIFTTGCWLLSLQDALSYERLPPTLNNKLRGLKCAEYFAQEWENLNVSLGDKVEFVAITRSEQSILSANPNKMTIIGSRRRGEIPLTLNIFNGKSGKKFSSVDVILPLVKAKKDSSDGDGDGDAVISYYSLEMEIEEDDILILTRGILKEELLMKISRIVSSEYDLTADLEKRLLKECSCSNEMDSKALMVSKVHLFNRFDENMNLQRLKRGENNGKMCVVDDVVKVKEEQEEQEEQEETSFGSEIALKHVIHLDCRKGCLTHEPSPGPFGCTTRHSVIYRSSYFAALHHDASKINRFKGTIDYIIRKVGDVDNLGKRFVSDGGGMVGKDSQVLARLSEIQYFAYMLLKGGNIHLVLGGGAKAVLLNYQKKTFEVIEKQILQKIKIEKGQEIILLSPHFTNESIFDGLNHGNVQINTTEWLNDLLKRSGVSPNNSKVSMALFSIM